MGKKWIKVLALLVIGLLALWYGVNSWMEAFSWFAWVCVLLGGVSVYASVDKVFVLTDRFERWKV